MQKETDLKGMKELVEQMDDKQILVVSWEADQDGAGTGSSECQASKGTFPV
ncbi:MAG: hypothetical protein ACRC3H_12150 [Lachnospiraceae bacterium]